MFLAKNVIKSFPKYSYGRFLYENPKATKSKKIKALQDFLNKTR